MARLRTAGRVVFLTVFGAIVVSALAGFALTRTRLGQELVLRQAVDRIAAAVNGELTVGVVRSRQLLFGGMFVDVVITDASGRPFLVADSIAVSYSIPRLLAGQIRFSRVIAHQPRLTLERLPGQTRFNVMRIFAGGRAADSVSIVEFSDSLVDSTEADAATELPREARAEEGGTQVAFRNLEIRNGRIDVVFPIPPGSPPPARGQWEAPPGVDGRVRRLTFDAINADLDEVRLVDAAFPGPLFVIDSLSTIGTVFDEPFDLRRFSGTVAWQDGGIRIDADELFLPGTEASATATVTLGEGGPRVRADVDAYVLALDDLRWAAPMLPADGVGAAQLSLTMRPGVTQVGWNEAEIDMGASHISGAGSLSIGDELTLDGVDMQLAPLELGRLQPYLPDSLPTDGDLRGRVRLAGPIDGPWMSAQVTLDQTTRGRAPTVADITGFVHLDGSPGVTDLTAILDPVQLDVLTDFFPTLGIRGPGTVRIDAAGRMVDGLQFTVDATHRPVDLPSSHVTGTGTITATPDDLRLDVAAHLAPLSFTAWRAYRPDLPVAGEVSGSVTAVGSVAELRVTSDLETVAGSMTIDAVFDARDPLASYRLDGELFDFRISELLPELPEPSTVTASFAAQGSGIGPEAARGSATVSVRDSWLGKLRVDTASANVRLAGGFLFIDTLIARTSVTELVASGSLALSDSLGTGQVTASFESSSLEGIRPFLMGDSLIARDTLSVLEREILLVEGIDPDTLPLLADIEVRGTANGDVTLTGSVRSFDMTGIAAVTDLQFGDSFLGRARTTFSASDLPNADRSYTVTVEAEDVRLREREFVRGRASGSLGREGGRVELSLARSATEDYSVRGTFELDSIQTVVHLDELTLRFPDRRWNLGGPARVVWSDGLVDIRDFRLHRPDGPGLDLRVEGRAERGAQLDLDVSAERVPLGLVAHLLQIDADLDGEVDVAVRLDGLPSVPLVTATVRGTGVGYENIGLDQLQGRLDYADHLVELDWSALNGDRTVLQAHGTVPVDLSLVSVEDRIPDESVDLTIVVDSFPAGLALGLLESLEEVEGVLTGQFEVGGTVNSPSPTGILHLTDGSALIPALGVRQTRAEAEFRLSPDGTIEVDGSVTSGGTMVITGSVRLDEITDPYLDLRAEGTGFLAANRADVLATIGGSVHVEGRYRRPLVEGVVNVEAGALFLDEVQRTAELVDLSDLTFLTAVDTAASTTQPLFEVGENPFLRSLRLAIDLGFNRNFWLRSSEMNVEIDGELQVAYDRTQRDLVFFGELQAVRGTYSRFGRQFQVQEGTVRFSGLPGLDPDLNVIAVNRLRVRGGEPLNIFASLEGTLLSPRVTLSSDAQPAIAQSELVSYLIFGRPTYELASNEFGLVQGEFGGLFGSAAGAGASMAIGALGTQLGSAVAQQIGLDYFAISQAQGATTIGPGLENSLRATQVEVGWYVAQDVFLALLLRPLLGINSSGISGARLEWRATDLWTVEGFLEDRFARELNSGFSVNEAFQMPKIWGLFLAREWGY